MSKKQKKIVSTLITIIGFIGSVVSIVGFLSGLEFHYWFPLLSVVLTVSGALYYHHLMQKGFEEAMEKETIKERQSWKNIHPILHLLRDDSCRTIKRWYSGSLNQDELRDKVTNTAERICGFLAEILSVLSDENVSVCIKIRPSYVKGTKPSDDLEAAQVQALARSHNTVSARNIQRVHNIKGNTDFEVILKEDQNYFVGAHLKDLYDKRLYNNSSDRWWEHYQSAVVTPIRIKESRRTESGTSEIIHLLGFLCADSLSPVAFGEDADTQSFYAEIMMAISDALYEFLYICDFVQKNEPPQKRDHEV